MSVRIDIGNLTDEQILTSAYKCEQRNILCRAYAQESEYLSYIYNTTSKGGKKVFKLNYLAEKNKKRFRMSGCLLTLIILIMVISMVYSFSFLFVRFSISTNGNIPSKVKISLYFNASIVLIIILRKIITKIIINIRYNSLKSRLLLKLEPTKKLCEELKARIDEIEQHLANINNCCIPSKYWDYAANLVNYIFTDFRASNLKEAINVLEDEIHKNNIMNKMKEIEQINLDNARSIDDVTNIVNSIQREQIWQSVQLSSLWWRR